MLSKNGGDDPRVVRSRELLEQSLLTLLKEKKLYNLSVSEIAKHAGVNRSTFYTHFYDKYALYRAVIRTTFTQAVSHIDGSAEAHSVISLKKFVDKVLDYFLYLNKECPAADRELRPLAEVEIQRCLQTYFREFFSSQRVNSENLDPSTNTVVQFVTWGLFGVGLDLSDLLDSDERTLRRERAQLLVDVLVSSNTPT
ncbi:MAG: TetR/AcrR family transcriptional regulator [Spirochaetales bacterium]|nr:TetR/AcrR family transcriptional regulator [Spirochaetales bacterium]